MPDLSMNQLHEIIAEVGHKATIAGSGGTILGWATSSEFGMWAGIVIGIAGLVVNWYFKRKSDIRNQQAHALYMQTLKQAETLRQLEPQEGES
jgi:hypothetical protein